MILNLHIFAGKRISSAMQLTLTSAKVKYSMRMKSELLLSHPGFFMPLDFIIRKEI